MNQARKITQGEVALSEAAEVSIPGDGMQEEGLSQKRIKTLFAGIAEDLERSYGKGNDAVQMAREMDLADYKDLIAACPLPEFDAWIHEVIARDGVDWRIGIDLANLGFIADYKHMAGMLANHGRGAYTIVDVGCSAALQHVFFSDFKGYVGIDYEAEKFKTFTPNAKLISGEFADLVESGQFVITDDMVGIANMSILYGNVGGNEKAVELFNRFKRKIIL